MLRLEHPLTKCEYGESNSSLSLGKATRYHYAILAEISPRLLQPPPVQSGVGIDFLDEDLLGRRADNLFANGPALE